MNDDPAYSRVRARRALADLTTDLGPGIPEALARSADLLRVDADHLDALAGAALTPFAGDDAPRAADLAALPAAIRARVLRRLLVARGARPGDLSAGQVAEVDRLVTHPRGQGPLHLPGVDVARIGNGAQARLSITPRGLV
jgi:tRNA(Ile)-lysidine synthase